MREQYSIFSVPFYLICNSFLAIKYLRTSFEKGNDKRDNCCSV